MAIYIVNAIGQDDTHLQLFQKLKKSVTTIKEGYFGGRYTVVALLDAISDLTKSQSVQIQSQVNCQVTAMQLRLLSGIDPFTGPVRKR
jgi:outer membrane protein TolC